MEEKWIFPTNGYGPENGLHSSDLETFMKDPLAALAREICQNSIDAAVETGENNNGAPVKPVEVEFSMFSVPRTKIPGIEEITAEIERCCDYKGNDEKEGKELKLMKKVVNSDEICCLRISDYNTTGLLGAGSNKRDTPFYSLTKGSGVSEKSTGSGGSKGIGKFAAFVASKLHTIFYSTVTKENGNDVAAFLGVSKLRSRPDDRDEELLTMGIGYYGSDEKNNPIKRELVLDENLPQRDGRCGTDIYVIGFAETKNWELDIIAKVLESFMVAIYRGHLSVKVQEQIVDKASLRSIVYNEDFKNRPSKVREYREILAQYEMLVGAEQENEKIERMEIPISEKDNVELYIRLYDETDKTQAIKHCIMVRHPYMKIKHITCQVHIPFSALCIIPRGDLNEVLRRIENPQHTDWELKRLDNFPDEQRMTKERQKELENKIKEAVREHLSRSLGEESDMEGAGEFL